MLLTRPSTVTVTGVDQFARTVEVGVDRHAGAVALSYGRRAGLRLRQAVAAVRAVVFKVESIRWGHRGTHQVEDCDQPAFG